MIETIITCFYGTDADPIDNNVSSSPRFCKTRFQDKAPDLDTHRLENGAITFQT